MQLNLTQQQESVFQKIKALSLKECPQHLLCTICKGDYNTRVLNNLKEKGLISEFDWCEDENIATTIIQINPDYLNESEEKKHLLEWIEEKQ